MMTMTMLVIMMVKIMMTDNFSMMLIMKKFVKMLIFYMIKIIHIN